MTDRTEVTTFLEENQKEIIVEHVKEGTITEFVKQYHEAKPSSKKRKIKRTDKMVSLLEDNETTEKKKKKNQRHLQRGENYKILRLRIHHQNLLDQRRH